MSAILGIFNLDLRPVALHDLLLMQQAVAYWGPDGSGVWSDGLIGFGHVLLRNTQESHYETQPWRQDGDRIVITAHVRLDNRETLLRTLEIPRDDWERTPDVLLLVKAYEKWGSACPEQFLGDWAFALWDAHRRTLLLARDHLGHAGLYYYRDAHRFIFSSSLKGILNLPDVPRRLNIGAVAQLGPGGKGDAATFYQDIVQLAPGRVMEVSSEKTTIRYYWHPKDIPDIRLSSDQDYVDAFLELYQEAIRCRLRSYRPVGLMLSGGLDSGSVATLAARELAQKKQRLPAFSWRPKCDVATIVGPWRMGDESHFIEEICAVAGNIDVTFTSAEDLGPLAGVKRALDILEQPSYTNGISYWMLAVLTAAQQRHVGTLLTGGLGNITVSWEGERTRSLKALLNGGQWDVRLQRFKSLPNLWRMAMDWGRGLPNPQLLGSGFARRLIRSEVARPILAAGSMADPDLAALHRQAPQPLRSIYNMFQSGSLSGLSEVGAAFGLEQRTPMTDKRIVEFCLGIPRDQYSRGSHGRLLIRRAMSGLMPEHILWNQHRGMLGGDIGQWYRDDCVEMETTLQGFEASPLAQHWLDLPLMNTIFRSSQHKLDPTAQVNLQILLRGIMVGLFLQRFE